jgi:DNA-directed RNA polymerase specialized sigma subunit
LKIPNNIDLSRTEWEHLIDEWIFNEREKEILKRRLLDGLTFEQLAEEFNYSDKNIQRIIYKGTARLFKKIK